MRLEISGPSRGPSASYCEDMHQGCINPVGRVAMVTEFCTVVPDVLGPKDGSWFMFHVTVPSGAQIYITRQAMYV